jgi:hypothetical protein
MSLEIIGLLVLQFSKITGFKTLLVKGSLTEIKEYFQFGGSSFVKKGNCFNIIISQPS